MSVTPASKIVGRFCRINATSCVSIVPMDEMIVGRFCKIPSARLLMISTPLFSTSGSFSVMDEKTDWIMFPSVPKISPAAMSMLSRNVVMKLFAIVTQSALMSAFPSDATSLIAASIKYGAAASIPFASSDMISMLYSASGLLRSVLQTAAVELL